MLGQLDMANRRWQHRGMTEPMSDGEIRQIRKDYDEDIERAMQRRDERLRAAIASGRKQVDLVRLMDMSREAIRQALNPEAREAVRAARAAKKQGGE
ncbi:hypothetical protein GCM10023334_029650 [Nonomuraea thailandensis]